MEKTVLLIGGNSGIGLATAKRLLSYGINLTAASRSTDQLSALGIPVQLFDAEDPGQLDLPETLDGLIYFPSTINLKRCHLQKIEKLKPFAFPLWAERLQATHIGTDTTTRLEAMLTELNLAT